MPEGLTTEAATRKLRDAIEEEANKFGDADSSWRNLFITAFCHRWALTGCWTLLVLPICIAIVFYFTPLFADGRAEDFWKHERVFTAATFLLFTVLLTALANLYIAYLRNSEIQRKISCIIDDLDEIISEGIAGLTTPSLYEPASENVTLQWTYRDGVLVNLPWIILVEGDVILLRPGREIPCRCKSIETDPATNYGKNICVGLEFESGQIYVPKEMHFSTDILGVHPFLPLMCRVLETPAAEYVRACLNAKRRPASLMENEYGRIVHFYLEKIGLPTILGISFCAAVFRYMYADARGPKQTWYETLILTPTAVILPLSAPVISLYTLTFVMFHTAKFLVRFAGGRDSIDEQTAQNNGSDAELFMEANSKDTSEREPSTSTLRLRNVFSCSDCVRLARMFWKLLTGHSASLPFTANIVQTLGNVTSLSVIDRKGMMSWANPTPEKVYFFSRVRHRKAAAAFGPPRPVQRAASSESLRSCPASIAEQDGLSGGNKSPESSGGGATKNRQRLLTVEHAKPLSGRHMKAQKMYHSASTVAARSHAEVLDLSHDPYRAFVVHFDDTHWRHFSPNLKPLGLNILLNGCNLYSEYIRFIDHVHAISAVVPRTVAVVNRRCMCYLAKAIGFNSNGCAAQFETQQTLAAYRKTPGDLPLPGLTKHKTPLPNLFAVVVKDKVTGHRQLMCQGTADLVADACDYYWDGIDVRPLERQHRKKIADFAHRHSMTAYCVAFSYRPLGCEIDRSAADLYIDSPSPAWRTDSESFDSAFEDDCKLHRVISYDSLLNDEYFSASVIRSPSEIQNRLLRGQVFLGMISFQYQAKPDVIRLVDSLDKACIRFVHYSKENELRSRIFAEKCGLEAGWNCHISLSRDSEAISASNSQWGSQQISKMSFRLARDASRDVTLSRYRSVPADLKIDLPVVHFKSAAASPISEVVPKVVCTLTDETNNSEERDVSQLTECDENVEYENENEAQPDDFGKVQRCASVATISGDSVFDDPADQQLIDALTINRERTPLLSDTTSRTSVATNHSVVHQPLAVMPNRARLPKGVENVRPHLENVDNVPLLVPLFTDCYPTAIVEMIDIMQEYGEVVCIVGSTLNFRNAEIFCQANASIGISPLHPAVCMNRTDRHQSETTDSPDCGLSATYLATLISCLPCSICIGSGEQIDLLDLISSSRHVLMVLRTSWIFYLASSLLAACVQLAAQIFILPRPFTVDSLLWLTCVVIPLLSCSLCATPQHSDVLKTATLRNLNWVSKNTVKKFITGFAMRFLPSAALLGLLLKCSVTVLCVDAPDGFSEKCEVFSQTRNFSENSELVGNSDFRGNSEFPRNRTFEEKDFRKQAAAIGLTASRHMFTWLFVFYLCVISGGYVHYRSLFKERLPFTNMVWSICVVALLLVQFIYATICIALALRSMEISMRNENLHILVPWKIYLCGLIWPLVAVPLNEILKYFELSRYHRDQRRRRLSFGTKLGMNSPF